MISATIIVAPTGVLSRMEDKIPNRAQHTEMIPELMITDLKLLNTRILDRAGKMISADTSSAPTRFIAITTTTPIIVANKMLNSSVFTPEAFAKFSSKVIANIL